MLQIAGLLLANPSNPASTAWCLIFHPRFRRSETGLCVSQCPGLARAVTHSDTFIGGGNSGIRPTSEADNYWPLLMWCLTDRYREQARSHKGSAPGTELCSPKINCGSEPARDEARTTTPRPPANKKPRQITPGRASTSKQLLKPRSSSYAYQSNAAPHPDPPGSKYRPSRHIRQSRSCAECAA